MQPLLRAGVLAEQIPGSGDSHAQGGAEPGCFCGRDPGDGAFQGCARRGQHPLVSRPSRSLPPAEEERKLAQLLRYASNIALMCGSGCAGAHKELP